MKQFLFCIGIVLGVTFSSIYWINQIPSASDFRHGVVCGVGAIALMRGDTSGGLPRVYELAESIRHLPEMDEVNRARGGEHPLAQLITGEK